MKLRIGLVFVLFVCGLAVDAVYADNGTALQAVPLQLRDVPDDANNSEDESPVFKISGYFQLWLTYEQAESGVKQPVTGDLSAQTSSGFSIRRARLSAIFEDGDLSAKMEIRLDDNIAPLDAYCGYNLLGNSLQVFAGQMKIPSTYEVETSSESLDFASRSYFSDIVCDWSLCRSPSISHPQFVGVRTYMRDMGFALKGETAPVKYYFMCSNGFGPNYFIGGDEKKQSVYSNDFGDWFMGLRVSADFSKYFKNVGAIDRLGIGGHVSHNRHSDLMLADKRTVLDVYRSSSSMDVQIGLFERLRLTVMIGRGNVDDDFDNDGKTDYIYTGQEYKIMGVLVRDLLEAGFRYDLYTDEYYQNGSVQRFKAYTVGLNLLLGENTKFQINYKWKALESDTTQDLDNDIFLLSFQASF